MAQLITENTGQRIQEMSDLVGAHGASDTANPPPFNGRFMPPKVIAAGKTYQSSIPGATDQDHPGVGEVIIDKLDKSATPPGFTKADVTNPQIVYNLTPVAIPHPSRLILWRDIAAFDSKGVASAWYVGGVQGKGGDTTILETPAAILTQGTTPKAHFDGDPAFDMPFLLWRTNDTTTFAPMFNLVESPFDPPYNGIRIKRSGDYIVRYGYNVAINGADAMSAGDNPGPGEAETVGEYILRHFQSASWENRLQLYRPGEAVNFSSTDPPLHLELTFFANTGKWDCVGDTDDFSLQADRTIRLHLNEFNGVSALQTISITIMRAVMEIWRIGPATDTAPL